MLLPVSDLQSNNQVRTRKESQTPKRDPADKKADLSHRVCSSEKNLFSNYIFLFQEEH